MAKAYLDGLGIQLKTFLLVGQELLNILTLVSLELNHLAHLSVIDDGAIAGCDQLATFNQGREKRNISD